MKRRTLFVVMFFSAVLLSTSGLFVGCKGSGEGHAPSSAARGAKYHCPMHPTYVSDKPGDCPICGMRLVPIESSEGGGGASGPAEGGATEPSAEVSGQAPVRLTPEREQLIGVRTAPVEKRDLVVLVRASARVAYDPDLYNAIAEYKEAVRTREKSGESPMPDAGERTAGLAQSSMLRLRQLGLSQDQIEGLTGAPSDDTNLLVGQPGGDVWVYAQIYEYESGLVKPGQVMELTSAALAGRRVRAKVVAVDAIVDAQTRSLKVRALVANPEGLLKPEMYLDAVIRVGLGSRLAVPEEAVLDTGTRQLLFVEKGPGLYDPREVRLGREAEDYREVLAGVKEGEKVVVSANFLIDSESKLKAAVSNAERP